MQVQILQLELLSLKLLTTVEQLDISNTSINISVFYTWLKHKSVMVRGLKQMIKGIVA
jgi:hypothetical protein